MAGRIVVFTPSPVLTVTIEDVDGQPDIHVHAGGQGIWEARMIASLGASVAVCAALGGETGEVLRALIGPHLLAQKVSARNGAYIHDRRDGARDALAEMPADPLSRHDLDDLYELMLVESIDSEVAVLSGPSGDGILPDELYERLTADLSGMGKQVVVDLSGPRLKAALAGGPSVVKVSDDELVADGRAKSIERADVVKACRDIAKSGAGTVVISRAEKPALAMIDGELFEVESPNFAPVDTKGGGDSLTAGLAAGLALGKSPEAALALGAAAGALNVTRHGLGSGSGDGVRETAKLVHLRALRKS